MKRTFVAAAITWGVLSSDLAYGAGEKAAPPRSLAGLARPSTAPRPNGTTVEASTRRGVRVVGRAKPPVIPGDVTPLGVLFGRLAQADPGRPAITIGDVTISRAELEARTNRLARAYRDLGVRPNSFVTIGLPNGLEFYEA